MYKKCLALIGDMTIHYDSLEATVSFEFYLDHEFPNCEPMVILHVPQSMSLRSNAWISLLDVRVTDSESFSEDGLYFSSYIKKWKKSVLIFSPSPAIEHADQIIQADSSKLHHCPSGAGANARIGDDVWPFKIESHLLWFHSLLLVSIQCFLLHQRCAHLPDALLWSRTSPKRRTSTSFVSVRK